MNLKFYLSLIVNMLIIAWGGIGLYTGADMYRDDPIIGIGCVATSFLSLPILWWECTHRGWFVNMNPKTDEDFTEDVTFFYREAYPGAGRKYLFRGPVLTIFISLFYFLSGQSPPFTHVPLLPALLTSLAFLIIVISVLLLIRAKRDSG
jgi:hypothetical protein